MYNTAKRKQTRSFLECVEDNLLTELVKEPMGNGVLLDLQLANREGFVRIMKFGGCLGHIDHELIVFDSWKRKEDGQQNYHPGLPEGRLQPVKETGWHSPLGSSPEGQRSPGKLDTLQERNLKGTGAGHPHVLKDKPAWKKTILAEQRAGVRAQKEKESF